MKEPKNMKEWNELNKEQQEKYLKEHPLFAKKLRIATEWSELMKDWKHEVKEIWK